MYLSNFLGRFCGLPFLIFLYVLNSCSPSKSTPKKICFEKQQEIVIPIDEVYKHLIISSTPDELHFSFIKSDTCCRKIVDSNFQIKKDNIFINEKCFDQRGLFFFGNQNYISYNSAGCIKLVEGNKNPIAFNAKNVLKINDSVKYGIYSNNRFNIIYNPPNIYFRVLSSGGLKNIYDRNIIFKYNYKTQQSNLFANFPDTYSEKKWWHIAGNKFSSLLVDKRFVLSFPMSDSLYIYQNDVIDTTIILKSNFLKNFPPKPFKDENLGNQLETMKWYNTKPRYYTMFTNQKLQLHFRVAVHGQDLKNKNGTNNLFTNQPFSIIVFNNKFEILTEQRFESSVYDFREIHPHKSGFIIKNNKETESELFFSYFELN